MTSLSTLATRLLRSLPPETAHAAALTALEAGVYPRSYQPDDQALGVTVAGLAFPNPVGLAAGFDKDARVPDAVLRMGCGFAEVGTVTPLPQAGNPRPRVFRLPEDGGLINRLGFNNGGHAQAFQRLTARRDSGIVGVNIGANRDATDRAADYAQGIATFSDVAQYFMVNISSPNTPGLRDLQTTVLLDALLSRVFAARDKAVEAGQPRRPVFVKLSPDSPADDLAATLAQLVRHKVDGIAIGNTTLAREGLFHTPPSSPRRMEAGGLSGRPLFQRSTVLLARVYRALEGKIPLIGIGGIESGETALAKIEAGASLIQLYTGLIYKGPALIGEIKSHLRAAVGRMGAPSISALVGTKSTLWAAQNYD